MFWTYTINEGQLKRTGEQKEEDEEEGRKRKSSLVRSLYIQVFFKRPNTTYGSLVSCTINDIDSFFSYSSRGSFYTLTWRINRRLYVLHTDLLRLYLYPKVISLSRQTTVNERQWYPIVCLTESYVIIAYVCCLSDIFHLYMYIEDKVKKPFLPHKFFIDAIDDINENISSRWKCLIKSCTDEIE